MSWSISWVSFVSSRRSPACLPRRAEPVAKRFVGCREVIERLGDIDGPSLERGPCGRLRQVARLDDDVFELPAEVGRQRGHVEKLSVISCR